MKKIFLLVIIAAVVLCGGLMFGCYPPGWYPDQKLPDYDESKAGAHIVRKIDLAGGKQPSPMPHLFLAKNSDKAYFVARNFFYEYDIPVPNEDQKQYSKYFILDINPLFDSTADHYYFSETFSLTAVEEYLYVLGWIYTDKMDSGRCCNFIMKPDGSDLQLFSSKDLFGVDLGYYDNFYYNTIKKKMYVCVGNYFDPPTLYVYDYDTSDDVFTLDTTTDIIRDKDEVNYTLVESFGYITEDHLWMNHNAESVHSGYIYLNTLERRSLDNPNNVEKTIDLIYLQYYSKPKAIIEYDGYVWVEITRYERQISKYYLLQLELNE